MGFRARPGPLPTEKPSRPFCLKPGGDHCFRVGVRMTQFQGTSEIPGPFPVADTQNPGAELPSGIAPPTLILQLGKPRPREGNGMSVQSLGSKPGLMPPDSIIFPLCWEILGGPGEMGRGGVGWAWPGGRGRGQEGKPWFFRSQHKAELWTSTRIGFLRFLILTGGSEHKNNV